MAVEFDLRLSISDRDFNERLDQAAAERAKLHEQQLARAAEEHSKVIRLGSDGFMHSSRKSSG
jgi:nucleoporin GLE1